MTVLRMSSSEMPKDRSAIEGDGFTATVASFPAPDRQDTWHHHGDHDIIAYVIAGAIQIESGARGGQVTELQPGDLVHIERGTIHRETYEGRIQIVGFKAGTGPGRVDVSSPGD